MNLKFLLEETKIEEEKVEDILSHNTKRFQFPSLKKQNDKSYQRTKEKL